MIIFSAVSIAFLGLITSLVVKNYNSVFKVFITITTCISILFITFPYFKEVLDMVNQIANNIDGGNFFIKEILKIIAIAYFAEISSSLCNDFGESSIAQKIELVGKVFILYTGHPIILSLLDIVVSFSLWR